MDTDNFLPKLTQNFLEILEDDEYYDITIEIVKILIVANELGLQEVSNYLQSILIQNKENWSDENLNLIYQTSLESDTYLELQNVCTELISKDPAKFFVSPSIPKKALVSLIQNDNLKMSATKVWDYVLKWGLAQNPGLSLDPSSYSQDDFNSLKVSLQECIPLIKFLELTSKEFLENVYPYKSIIPEELFDKSVKYLMDESNRIVNFESSILTFNHAELISKWIDKLEITNEITATYDFKLLARLRGALSGQLFHGVCGDKFPTVSIIKVKGSDEILGGYNPITWVSGIIFFYGATKDSFIFSFKDKNDINNHILSRVKNEQRSIYNHFNCGPGFGYSDLIISPVYGNRCIMSDYDKPIRETNDSFEVEICELFLLTKK
ncbi:1171_t:CDS:2 [Funneliformis caledonium]|uniref:1171_t:CDS:1 n=1 Tax=Funneliformis caledonium TaxID=1117310 RepID=A0A9N9DP22_9GLOM|nr:1171_t:CDS:2 [Funneliformis caledonium]